MRVAYTVAQMAEAVALANVIGAEAAGDQLGIDPRSVRKWQGRAGVRPELEADDWQGLHDLALARTTAAVASGKLSVRTVAVIAGIAARNLRMARPPKAVEPEEEPSLTPLADAAVARWEAWLDTLEPEDRVTVQRHLRDEIDDEFEARGGIEVRAGAGNDDELEAHAWEAILSAMQEDWESGDLTAHVAEREARNTARSRQRTLAGRWLSDDEADLLIEAENALEDIA